MICYTCQPRLTTVGKHFGAAVRAPLLLSDSTSGAPLQDAGITLLFNCLHNSKLSTNSFSFKDSDYERIISQFENVLSELFYA